VLTASCTTIVVLIADTSPSADWSATAPIGAVDPLVVAAAVARVVALVGFGYLAVLGLLHLVVELLVPADRRAGRPHRLLARITPRLLVVAMAGMLTSTASIGPVAAEDAAGANAVVASPDDVPVMHLVEPPAAGAPPTTDSPHTTDTDPRTSLPWADPPMLEPTEQVEPERVDPQQDDPGLPTGPTPAPNAEHRETGKPDAAAPPSVAVPEGGRRVHVVEPGEHFWSIAEEVVAQRPDADLEVADYWRLLVEANRDRLVDRDNPDLIHPGQELVLP
jgi:hypothetical protein